MTKKAKNKKSSSKRLRPGELDGLVLTHLRKHKDEGPVDRQRYREGDRAVFWGGRQLSGSAC